MQFRLFNNAGVDFAKAFEQTEANDWVRVVDTDLRGVCLCARRVALAMLKSGGGVIVDIAFVHSIAGLPVAADADECLNFWKSNIPMGRVRQTGRNRQCGCIPGQRQGQLHHRFEHPCRRWHDQSVDPPAPGRGITVVFTTFAGFPPDGPPRTCATPSATRP